VVFKQRVENVVGNDAFRGRIRSCGIEGARGLTERRVQYFAFALCGRVRIVGAGGNKCASAKCQQSSNGAPHCHAGLAILISGNAQIVSPGDRFDRDILASLSGSGQLNLFCRHFAFLNDLIGETA
jgi:hypothetical protein